MSTGDLVRFLDSSFNRLQVRTAQAGDAPILNGGDTQERATVSKSNGPRDGNYSSLELPDSQTNIDYQAVLWDWL